MDDYDDAYTPYKIICNLCGATITTDAPHFDEQLIVERRFREHLKAVHTQEELFKA